MAVGVESYYIKLRYASRDATILPLWARARLPNSPRHIFLGIPLALRSLVDGAKSMPFDGHSAVADKQHIAASLRLNRRKELKNTTQTFSRQNRDTNRPCDLGTGWKLRMKLWVTNMSSSCSPSLPGSTTTIKRSLPQSKELKSHWVDINKEWSG